MSEARNIAVIGLGSMGYGMASSIRAAGHTTWGVDIAPAAMQRFRDEGGAVELKFSLYGALILSVVVVTADSLLGS